MKFTKNIGFTLLGIYLILIGIVPFVPVLNIPPMINELLALVAGVFILIGK